MEAGFVGIDQKEVSDNLNAMNTNGNERFTARNLKEILNAKNAKGNER
jgi:hypothetical protein